MMDNVDKEGKNGCSVFRNSLLNGDQGSGQARGDISRLVMDVGLHKQRAPRSRRPGGYEARYGVLSRSDSGSR